MIFPSTVFKEIKPYLQSAEAVILTGMRRTGKTTMLNSIQEQIASKNKLFLDLENPLNRKYFEAEPIQATCPFHKHLPGIAGCCLYRPMR
ncbi:MAG: AAA family ATPase [Nitrospirae bacterium]|nr:AAA family ATPase [Nitrospirota bacterium]